MKVKYFIFLILLAACSGERQSGPNSAPVATEMGLSRTLPPPVEEVATNDDVDDKRNIMVVLVCSNDKLMVNGEMTDVKKLKDRAKEFIANPSNKENLPVKESVDIPLLGTQLITSKHIIYLNNEQGTSYQSFLDVQNELLAAYSELRNELSVQMFSGRMFEELTAVEQDAVMQCYPQKISEEVPKVY